MKKLILLFALAGTLGVSFAATDSFIYWMVSEDATGTGRSAEGPVDLSGGTYYAKISAFASGQEWTEGGGKYLNILSSSADNNFASKGESVSVTIGADNVSYFASLAEYAGAGWTYYVELWNDGAVNGKVVARSEEGLTYAKESIVALSGMNAPGAQVWAPMTFVPAPEPNSAMLLLIGCAALALRRRKQVAA